MKVVKTQVVLFMYEILLEKHELDPIYVKAKFDLDDKKFYRYIQELKSYYAICLKRTSNL